MTTDNSNSSITKQDLTEFKEDIKIQMGSMKEDLTTQIVNVRKDLTGQMGSMKEDLTTQIVNVRKDLTGQMGSMKEEMGTMREDLSIQIVNVRKDLTTEISNVRKDLTGQMGLMKEGLTTQMGVLYERFSGEVKFVAEQVGAVLDKQQENDRKIDLLIETTGEIKVDVEMIRDELQNKVDITDHQKLEKRVSGLEATL